MSEPYAEHVVCVHGIWMIGAEFAWLRRSLRRAGFASSRIRYPSLRASLDDNARQLAGALAARRQGTLHIVAHSLGGLVVLRALEIVCPANLGRVVFLGSPVRGSQVARHALDSPWLRWTLGRSTALAGDYTPVWRHEAALGVIAGTRSLGIGRLLSPLASPNDGTVAVAETRIGGAADRIELPVTHMGLVFDHRVCANTAAFLQHGTFSPVAS